MIPPMYWTLEISTAQLRLSSKGTVIAYPLPMPVQVTFRPRYFAAAFTANFTLAGMLKVLTQQRSTNHSFIWQFLCSVSGLYSMLDVLL
jgi:hypothetical protein